MDNDLKESILYKQLKHLRDFVRNVIICRLQNSKSQKKQLIKHSFNCALTKQKEIDCKSEIECNKNGNIFGNCDK